MMATSSAIPIQSLPAERPQTPPSKEQPTQKMSPAQTQGSPLRFHDRESPKSDLSRLPSVPPRKPLPAYTTARMQGGPVSPVQVNYPSHSFPPRSSSAQIVDNLSAPPVPAKDMDTFEGDRNRDSNGPLPVTQSLPYRQTYTTHTAEVIQEPQRAVLSSAGSERSNSPRTDILYENEAPEAHSRHSSNGSNELEPQPATLYPQLQYHHQQFLEGNENTPGENRDSHITNQSRNSNSPTSSTGENGTAAMRHLTPGMYGRNASRPTSAYSTVSDNGPRGRTTSPGNLAGSPMYGRSPSAHSPFMGERPQSYVDLLNVPYHQQIAPSSATFNNAHLRNAVGTSASLLSHKQTLDMYRANIKKTNDPAIQYEFAIFMINTAREAEAAANGAELARTSSNPQRDLDSPYVDNSTAASMSAELYKEARHILQKLADKSYPFAQYYLADGYSSGLFHKNKPDLDKAFPLFQAAAKHGHAESGYRTGLCYEYGWGCRKDYAKAVQFYRQSASKNHPGAMLRLGKACLSNDLGLGNRYREGIKWLKRATESADAQYNAAPYKLAILHEEGYGDDIFQDVSYAAQLYTQAAELGHADANFRMGVAYEHGELNCPRDAGLSIHFYNGAAQRGHPEAMMALCAWYVVGAEPVLEKDETEAYEWARRAAELGLPKAQYAVGYFTESGIGCRRDPLEANVWYVKAADQGEPRAMERLRVIQAAASGQSPGTGRRKAANKSRSGGAGLSNGNGVAASGNDKDCIVM